MKSRSRSDGGALSPAVRVLIVDDQPLALERLRRLVEQESGATVVGEARDGRAAVREIRALDPDMVLLDIQMPLLDGFGVISTIGPDRMPPTIFVTAFDEHALRAFRVNAVDYLLKPFDSARFRQAFDRARKRLRYEDGADRRRRLQALYRGFLDLMGDPDAGHPSEWRGRLTGRLALRSAGRISFVDIHEIHWIEAAGNYVRLHLAGETHLMRAAIGDLEVRLSHAGFVRIHRSTLVNLDQIKEMRHWSSGEYRVELRSGERLTASRTYRERLLSLLAP